MEQRSSAGLSYVPGLDGLRACAIGAVLLCHANVLFSGVFPANPLARAYALITGAGWIGVDLFFVLSGFLITRILLTSKGQQHYFRNFYMRRTLRIFPLYYLYVFLVVFLLPYGIHHGSAGNYWRHPDPWARISVLFYFYNFEAAHLGRHLPLINQFWSLAVEEHFYLVWPLVVSLARRRTLVSIAIGGIVFALLSRIVVFYAGLSVVAAYVITPCRIDGLLVGALLALAHSHQESWARVVRWAPPLSVLSLGVIAVIALRQGHFYDFVNSGEFPGVPSSWLVMLFGITALAVFFGSIVATVIQGSAFTDLLEHPVLRRIGHYSYGIYVYHMLAFALVMAILLPLQARHPVPLPCEKLALAVFGSGLSFALAAFSYKYVEVRFLKLKALFPNRPDRLIAAGNSNQE